MSLENNEQVKSGENQEHSAKVDNSRRSFAKKSAAIAPVIMTLANRSAWGGTNVCSNSGWNSFHAAGNRIASHAAIVPNNQWKYYTYWATAPGWPGGFDPLTSTVEDIVGGIYPGDITLASTALGAGGLKAHQIATVLNNLQSPGVPEYLLSASAEIKDFDDFYKACL